MKYAKKIHIDIDFPAMSEKNKIVSRHGKIAGIDEEVLVCRHIHRKYLEKLRILLPEEIRPSLIRLRYCEVNVITPHIHLNDRCVINFYQNTNKEETSFWEGDTTETNKSIEDNGNGYTKTDLSKIKIVESFVASPGDIWLLNTQQPHSVTLQNDKRPVEERFIPLSNRPRYMVQASLDMNYEDVVKFF